MNGMYLWRPWRLSFLLLLLHLTTECLFAQEIVTVRSKNPDGVPTHSSYRNDSVLGRIPNDATAVVVSRQGTWLEVRYPAEPGVKTSWITRRYVVSGSAPANRAGAPAPAVIDNATFHLPPPCKEGNLRLGTWNIRNFTIDERPYAAGDGFIRESNVGDFQRVLIGLDVDLLAVQEIRDKARFSAMLKEINASTGRDYTSRFTRTGGASRQHVGFVIDNNKLDVAATWEINEVNITGDPRPAFAVEAVSKRPGGADFTAVAVHLKAVPTGYDTRRMQMEVLIKALLSMSSKGTSGGDFVIMGDFNSTGAPGGSGGAEIGVLDREFKSIKARRIPNSLPCTEYWDGPVTRDGIQISGQLDLVYGRSLAELDTKVPLKSWLHCARLDCGELVSDRGEEDPTYWDVSDHCPVLFEIQDRDLD